MADLQFLSVRAVSRFCVLLFVVNLFIGTVFTPECHAWIFFYKPEYRGQVIDAETGEPIEGVAVVAVYWKYEIIGGPAGPNSRAINWRETVTNENGLFRIPSYTTLVAPNAKAGETRFIFYKPGYRSSPVWPGPDFLWILGPDAFFTEEIGKPEEIELGIKNDLYIFTYGVITLKPADTYDERLRSSAISTPFGIKDGDLPILHKYMKKEVEWLRKNKGWRRHEESK